MMALRLGKLPGASTRRTCVASKREEGVPQRYLRRLGQTPQFHQRRSPRHPPHRPPRRRPHRPRRRRPRRPPHAQSPLGQWIRSIALWILRTHGKLTRRRGVAGCIIRAVHQQHHLQLSSRSLHLQIRTIVQMGSQIGRLDGLSRRRAGVARCTGRAAQARAVRQGDPLLPPTIATPASQIGWPVGLFQKKHGAARMRVRVVHLQRGGAHDRVEQFDQDCWPPGAPCPAPNY